MYERIANLSGKSMLPASLLLTGWLAMDWVLDLRKDSDINTHELSNQKVHQVNILKKLDRNNERLARIEVAIEFIKTRLK